MPIHQAWRDGDGEPDPLIHDDQAVVLHVRDKGLVVLHVRDKGLVVLHVRDKGLVVLTGCGHSGIVNVVRHAKALTGIDLVYAVLGGFQLTGGILERIIAHTVTALAAENPAVVVPAHCTGRKAQHALAAGLPGAFRPNFVGSRYEL